MESTIMKKTFKLFSIMGTEASHEETSKKSSLNERSIKIQFLSDLHLELQKKEDKMIDIPVLSDFLILAGDIGDPFDKGYEEFLRKVSREFCKVFVVLGNHEFYGHNCQKTREQVRKICERRSYHNNMIFLDKSSFLITEGLRILGCTLWSEVPEEYESTVYLRMTDYSRIKINIEDEAEKRKYGSDERKITVEDTVKIHRKEVKFIEEEMKKAKKNNEKLIVVTHHGPLIEGLSCMEHDKSILGGFQSDLSRILEDPVVCWIFGHTLDTHDSRELVQENGVVVVSNQIGYEDENCGYDEKLVKKIHF